MRLLLIIPLVFLGAIYVKGALQLYQQDLWTRTPAETETVGTHYRHPEATLGVVKDAFASNNFSPEVLNQINRSLAQVPSFYQPPLLLATYHEARREAPEKTGRCYEFALTLYPANGRLRLGYAQWLLSAQQQFTGTVSTSETLGKAQREVERALELEPDLTGDALEILLRFGIPPETWADLVPRELPARQQLFRALSRAGHRHEALRLLKTMLERAPDPMLYQQAAGWALTWGDPALAADSARRWQEEARSSDSLSGLGESTLQLAKAHLVLGEKETAYKMFREGLKEIESRSAASAPPALELLCKMAYEYLRGNQWVMAESLFAEASALAPYHAEALLGLARTYRKRGDRTAGIELYQKYLQLEPTNSQAEKELAQLILERELSGDNR